MQLNNPLQMNDWPIKSFILVIFSFQVFLLGLIGLDSIDIHIPIIRQLSSFIILTFIPGVLILRILNIHNLGSAKTVLYSVGLSIASLMLLGLFMNKFYPFFGILKPISLFNLIVTINFFILLLCFFSYFRDRNFSKPDFVQVEELLSPSLLFLCLVPFLSIFGTYLLNDYGNNTLQMAFSLLIAIFPLITLKWIPKKLYPLVILVLSLSLLLHTSLLSPYTWGADINLENTLANYVINNGLWDASINANYNTSLSVVLLAPIYSIIANLSLIWCLKIIYPAIFSLVPVGLFVVYNKLTNHKIAFLACIFFIIVGSFFTELPALARQEIAELFLALLLMIIIDEKISGFVKSILLVLFGFSLVISHYGLTFVFSLIIVASILVLLVLNKFPAKFRIKDIEFGNYIVLNYIFILFLLCCTFGWFIFVSGAEIFKDVTLLGNSIITSLTDILNPETSQGYAILKGSRPIFQSIERYLYVISYVFIAIGILNLLFDKKFNPEFKALSIASFFILVMGVIFPYLSGALNTERLLHISLFFLSIFLVTGFIAAIMAFNRILNKIFKFRSFKIGLKQSFYIIGVFLMIFSIFSTAFVYQVFDQPKIGRFALDSNQDFYWVTNQEISGIKWFKNYSDPQTKIYTDMFKSSILLSFIYWDKLIPQVKNKEYDYGAVVRSFDSSVFLNDSYVFFGRYNIFQKRLLVETNNTSQYIKDPDLENKINKLYDNGESWILKGLGS